MGLHILQFSEFVVVPTLKKIGLFSEAAHNLLMGTALQESDSLVYIDQTTKGPGPGYGIFQMERLTCNDMWNRVLPLHPALHTHIIEVRGAWPSDRVLALHGNHNYAAAMCRVKYFSIPTSLPGARDRLGLAEYWKQHYNTYEGKGTIQEFLDKYKKWERLT